LEEIPAVCLKCGYVFPSGIAGENVGSLTVVGAHVSVSTTNSCPRCKGPGRLTDRNLPIKEAIEAILLHTRSAEDLDEVRRIIDEAIKGRQNREEVIEAIESRAIRYAWLAALLPRDQALWTFLGALAAIFTLIEETYILFEAASNTGKTGAGTRRAHIPGSGTRGRYPRQWPSRQ
jgi:hypothetical protein